VNDNDYATTNTENSFNDVAAYVQAGANYSQNLPMDNRQPFLAISYIIAVYGLYPSN
jgi:microcystin-dependent protein